jgi:diacylglycerol kinase family enzyme
MNVTLIHNSDAGSEESCSANELLGLVREAGHAATQYSLKDKNWESALQTPVDIVAVAGGDGTVGKVARCLIGRRIPVAVLPMGTANNIANTLGLMDRPAKQLISEWTSMRRLKFDVGMASGPWGSKYFIEGLGIGLFTETMYRLDATGNVEIAHLVDADEKMTSVLQMLKERLQSFPPKKLKITLDGRDLSGEYILLEIMNIRHIGPNLSLAIDADPSDGAFDIVLVSRLEQDSLSQCLSDCMDGKISQRALTVHQGQHLQIHWSRFPIHIDDEVWPNGAALSPLLSSDFDVKIKRHALEFLAPA